MNQITPFDPISDYYKANPYSEFKRMREQCPVYRHEGTLLPTVSVFKNDDIRSVMADPETFSSELSAESNKVGRGLITPLLGEDPPGHTEHRRIIAPFFMPAQVQQMMDQIESLVTEVMDESLEKSEIDFVEDFAAEVTVGLIAGICGVPREHWPFIRKQTLDLSRDYGKAPFFKEPQPEIEARIANYGKAMNEFIAEHVKYLRRTSTPSILTEIGKSIKDDAIFAAVCAIILGAGNETTANLITHSLYELIHHPSEFEKLRREPALLPNAVEEFVRYRGTLRRHERRATRDTEIRGIPVYKNDAVVLWGASASRDPEAIERPEEFDISRKVNRHHGFGSGIHMCIGNALARAETKLIYKHLLARTTTIEETRGADSYESWGNGILDAAKRYSVRLVAR